MFLKLGTINVHHKRNTDSCSNLQTDVQFKRAVVTTGTWIFYTYPNYNNQEAGGTSSNYKILNPGADEDISSVNGSMYLVMDATEGILLFEHSYYGGTREVWIQVIDFLVSSVWENHAVLLCHVMIQRHQRELSHNSTTQNLDLIFSPCHWVFQFLIWCELHCFGLRYYIVCVFQCHIKSRIFYERNYFLSKTWNFPFFSKSSCLQRWGPFWNRSCLSLTWTNSRGWIRKKTMVRPETGYGHICWFGKKN